MSKNTQEVEAVRLIFDLYTNRALGLRGVAAELNKRGIPAPEGGLWGSSSVRNVLTKPVYVGDYSYGRTEKNWFHRFTTEGIVESDNQQEHQRRLRPRGDWYVKEDEFEAFVRRHVWEAAQTKDRSNN